MPGPHRLCPHVQSCLGSIPSTECQSHDLSSRPRTRQFHVHHDPCQSPGPVEAPSAWAAVPSSPSLGALVRQRRRTCHDRHCDKWWARVGCWCCGCSGDGGCCGAGAGYDVPHDGCCCCCGGGGSSAWRTRATSRTCCYHRSRDQTRTTIGMTSRGHDCRHRLLLVTRNCRHHAILRPDKWNSG